MRRVVTAVVLTLGILVAAAAAWIAWASAGWGGGDASSLTTGEVASEAVVGQPNPPGFVKVVTWNVGFGGGATGQPTDRHPAEEVLANLQAVADLVKATGPDLVFLQEVDRPSDRSGGVDQFEVLRKAVGLPHACFVQTWDVRYVPFPYWPLEGQVGRVRSGQAILSRFPIESCRRVPLPQPAEKPWWYNRFFLHRALQVARLRLGPTQVLDAVNVHLEAFFQGNRERQAGLLADLVRSTPADVPMVVAGDFNALPPGATRVKGFADEPEADFTGDRTLALVRDGTRLREVFLDDRADAPEDASLTFPSVQPTRRLDYVFHRGLGDSLERAVPRSKASDHRPLQATLPTGLMPPPPP